jgi:hypothetical protein
MLFVQVERHGGQRRWSRLLDVPYFAPRSEVGAWPDERIRTELRRYLHGRPVWPSVKQFAADGHGALRRAVNWTGGQTHWAREMGVELAPRRAPHTRWTEARIKADLARFVKGGTEWPPRREFYAAGLGGLYCAIRSRHTREALAAELDLRLPQGRVYGRKRWTDEAIRHSLDEMLQGRDSWPTRDEFREAGVGTLHRLLTETGTRDEWAHRYGLSPVSQVDDLV